jgi:tetratricopeptide (TPR) repeat protein
LLKTALTTSGTDEARSRILLCKAFTLQDMGDYPGAIEVLEEVRPLVERIGDTRNRWILLFNFSVSYADAGRYQDAKSLLPEIQRLAAQLGNGLDLLRGVWLRARILEGLGRLDEAIADLEQVRGEFASRGIPFDTARACLDLAALYLQQGRTNEVKRLADQMVKIFRTQQVHREAMAAVLVFHKAVEKERATVELARRLSDYLRRAQHDPNLRFDACD